MSTDGRTEAMTNTPAPEAITGPRATTNFQGFPYCTDPECRAKWNHAHGVNPDYPTVVALATTPAERAALVMRGYTIWAPNY